MKNHDRPKYCYVMGRYGYIYFRRGDLKSRMPDDPCSAEFKELYDDLIRETNRNPTEDIEEALNKNELDQVFRALEAGARQRSRRFGREYSLPRYWGADTYYRQGGICAISGVLMRRSVCAWDAFSPSIDRKDSALGYTPENCQLTTFAVNRAKSQMTMDEFLEMCRNVTKNAP